MYENAGSPHALLEDRESCAAEINESPDALAYRQNPSAHPDYPNQVFEVMNRCIEHKGWKQVRSQQEQEEVSRAISSELARTGPPQSRNEYKDEEATVRAIEGNMARSISKNQDLSLASSN